MFQVQRFKFPMHNVLVPNSHVRPGQNQKLTPEIETSQCTGTSDTFFAEPQWSTASQRPQCCDKTLPHFNHDDSPATSSVAFPQITKRRYGRVTFEIRSICFLWQNTSLSTKLPTPLSRGLGLPCPVKPTPCLLEAVDLSFGKHLEKLLVRG